jgi:hypothetical protein
MGKKQKAAITTTPSLTVQVVGANGLPLGTTPAAAPIAPPAAPVAPVVPLAPPATPAAPAEPTPHA